MKTTVPRPVTQLIEALSRLPGIGPKSASRLTYHLLRSPEGEAIALADAIRALRRETCFCSNCFNITSVGQDPCMVCRDSSRNGQAVCVVEEPLDVVALERTGQFDGRYHVLHGALSPVEGVGPEDLHITELLTRIEREGIHEVILATNPTLEGEATAMYLKQQLGGMPVKITRLARGLPSGGDLEYADANTLSQALQGRVDF